MLFISHLPLESAYLGQLYKTKIRSPVAAVLMSGSRLHFFTFTFVLHSAPCIRSPPHHCTVYPFALCTCITNMSMNDQFAYSHYSSTHTTTYNSHSIQHAVSTTSSQLVHTPLGLYSTSIYRYIASFFVLSSFCISRCVFILRLAS